MIDWGGGVGGHVLREVTIRRGQARSGEREDVPALSVTDYCDHPGQVGLRGLLWSGRRECKIKQINRRGVRVAQTG